MHIDVIATFLRLLDDISSKSGIRLGSPDVDLVWLLSEGPRIDKALLADIESGAGRPNVPEWLMPLVDAWYSTKCPRVLRWLRQALCFVYKLEHESTSEQLEGAIAAFKSAEQDVLAADSIRNSAEGCHHLVRSASALVGRVIYRIDWRRVKPSHGPGAVFPPRDPMVKARFNTIYADCDTEYPFYEFFGLPYKGDLEQLARIDNEAKFAKCKLTFVPKDSRGPRMICVHPGELIWIQQGQRKLLEQAIESHYLTGGRINFRDQGVNGELALVSSRSGRYATLDLKDASDRLSADLVKALFGGAYRWIAATRATHVVLPDRTLMPLAKFAPMGNCLTFPVQSLCFWAVVRANIKLRCGVTCNDIFVFGDDIIVPTEYVAYAKEGLTRVGLMVNEAKSFWRGLFRESCGVDAFNGFDVTPLRLKKGNLSSWEHRLSLSAFAKNLRKRGYESAASYLYTRLRRELGYLPLGNDPAAQGIYEYVDRDLAYLLANEPRIRYADFGTRRLQRYETPVIQVQIPTRNPEVHDWYHVLDSLVKLENSGDAEEKEPWDSDDSPRPAGGQSYPSPYGLRVEMGWTAVAM